MRKVNGRPLPNNPKQAYMLGKLHGTQDTMGNVAMVLLDKCGWHIKEQTADAHDTMSISYLYECIVALAEEINAGRIKRKDIADASNEGVTTFVEKDAKPYGYHLGLLRME